MPNCILLFLCTFRFHKLTTDVRTELSQTVFVRCIVALFTVISSVHPEVPSLLHIVQIAVNVSCSLVVYLFTLLIPIFRKQ